MSDRINVLQEWATTALGLTDVVLTPLQQDASLRRFYRLDTKPSSVLMDAALDTKNKEYLASSKLLKSYGLHTPEIFYHDLPKGLFQVEDFGDTLLIHREKSRTMPNLLTHAVDAIQSILHISLHDIEKPMVFDETFINGELHLFSEWFIKRYLEVQLTNTEQETIQNTFRWINQVIASHPFHCIHRDFHSKNIMVLPDERLGILDFQDLMIGPVTYDLVSLLKDCYVNWEDTLIVSLLTYFYEQNKKVLKFNTFEEFIFYFNITGLQRHLKVLGIFSRIYFERGNSFYLQYFDRIEAYIIHVLAKHPKLNSFYSLFMKLRR